MNLDQIPLFSMLKSRLGYVGQREKLISQNVANADTPGYAPRDLKTFTVGGDIKGHALAMALPRQTSSAPMIPLPTATKGGWKPVVGSDSETTMDGNKVVLEEQMAKMTESRMDYEAAIGFYQKSLDMLKLAARAPGR